MKTSQTGLALIESSEGFAAQIYNDNGKQAIGFGHDLLPAEVYPFGVTVAEARMLLKNDLDNRFEPLVTRLAPQANQNQFDALVSFTYNLGGAALQQLLAHGWDQVPAQMERWNHENGTVSAALAARRQREVALFVAPLAS